MVVALKFALEDKSKIRKGRACDDRRIERIHPARQEPEPRADSAAHVGVVAARGGESLGQLDEAHAEGQHDQESEQVSERGMRARETHDRLGEEERGNCGGYMRDILHNRTGQPHSPGTQVGLGDPDLASFLDRVLGTRLAICSRHPFPPGVNNITAS